MKKRGKFRKGIFAVVYRKEKNNIFYLVLKRKLHWKGWEFPKGGVKGLEFIKKTVKREIFEETGQKPVKILKLSVSGKYSYDREYPERLGYIGQSYRLFAAEIKDKKIRLDKKEHSAYKWLNFATAFKFLKWINQKKCLKIVNKSLQKNEADK